MAVDARREQLATFLRTPARSEDMALLQHRVRQLRNEVATGRRRAHDILRDNLRQHEVIKQQADAYANRLKREVEERTRELEVQKTKAEEADRLKSEFLANISHEIRTPLNSIIGFADPILNGETSLEESRRHVATMRTCADHLMQIINDILDLSKIESGRLTVARGAIRISEVVEQAVAMILHRAEEKGLAVTVTVDPAAPTTLRADGARVRQILINLVGNAIKFTREGRIDVEVRPDGLPDTPCGVRISVRDTGVGIPETVREKIFLPFVQGDGTTRRRHGGTGLGLAICQRLVGLLGGKIAFESEEGRGSAFHFTIPDCSEESADTPETDAPESPQPTAPPPRPGTVSPARAAPDGDLTGAPAAPGTEPGSILVVDDIAMNVQIAAAGLRKAHYRVLTATNGFDAVRVAKEQKPDLILLDVMMPDKDGFEVCRELKSAPGTAEIPVIFLTARDDAREVANGLKLGAVDYITKPFSPVELLARASTQLKVKQLQDQLRRAARTDALTGLFSRGHFEDRLEEEFRRFRRYKQHFACVMLDIDHFKRINDSRGHRFGDAVLAEIGGRITTTFRDSDVAARYGGEEFAVLLPESDLAGACAAAERLWRSVRERAFASEDTQENVTVSIGVASTQTPAATNGEILVKLADQALYAAKTSGRDRACFWEDEGARPVNETVGAAR